MLDKNRVVAYSLLAHINDHKAGIKDLSELFEPLISHALMTMYNRGARGGQLVDLKDLVDSLYSLDVPYPLLARVLRQIASEQAGNDRVDLVVHSDESFVLRQFALSGFDDRVRTQESDLDWLEAQYKSFLDKHGFKSAGEPSIYEFLDRNRVELSEYMSRHVDVIDTAVYKTQARFVNSLPHNSREYSILRRIYLGSVIASYLEMRIEPTQDHSAEFLLDTSFIVGLFDLASTESNHTCSAVVRIARSLGYNLTVLDMTIEETTSLLRRIASTLESAIFTAHLDPESIESACERRNIKKTDLERIARQLQKSLESDYGVSVIKVTPELHEQAEASEVYAQTTSRPYNPDGAPHDGIAYYYTQSQRGREVEHFDEAKCWFVGNSRHRIQRRLRKANGFLNERIHASYLVNILWLSFPSALKDDPGELGLTRLVASTMRQNLPSPELLHELDENIKKCAANNIRPEDLAVLASSSAAQATENLEQLNQAAKSSADEFCVEVKRLARIAKEERLEEQEIANQKVKDSRRSLEETENKYKDDLEIARKEGAQAEERAIEQGLKSELKQIELALKPLELILESLSKDARTSINRRLATLVIILLAIHAGIYILALNIGWSKVEGWVSFLSFVPWAVAIVWFVVKKQTFNPRLIYRQALSQRTNRLHIKNGLNPKHVSDLKQRKEEIISKLGVE